MVSSDLTSHIPSQEGWSLRQKEGRGRSLEGVELIGMEAPGTGEGGSELHQEAGARGSWD